MSALKAVLDGAAAFVEGIGEGRRPSPQLWGQARRIFAGFWPVPSREDWGEAGGDDAASGAEGEDGEGVATRGARAATLLVRDAAWVVWAAARDARQREAQQGEGVARRRAGDEEGGSDEEDADETTPTARGKTSRMTRNRGAAGTREAAGQGGTGTATRGRRATEDGGRARAHRRRGAMTAGGRHLRAGPTRAGGGRRAARRRGAGRGRSRCHRDTLTATGRHWRRT